MGPTPVYGARAEKKPKNAVFAMKQTNICRLSGDITRGAWQIEPDVRPPGAANPSANCIYLVVIPLAAMAAGE